MFLPFSLNVSATFEQILGKLAEIAQQIHQLTALDDVLNYAVQETRLLSESDRALIYQFLPDGDGVVIAESVAEGWQPIVGQLIYDPCLQNGWTERFRQGHTTNIIDVETSDLPSCHLDLLIRLQVRANLVIPILTQAQSSELASSPEVDLWGLLIVHQCHAPQSWNSLEVQVLKQLAVQLGIAIDHYNATNQIIAAQQEHDRFFKNAHDLMAKVDSESRITLANLGWQRILGYTLEELIGVRFFDLVHPDDVDIAFATFQHHMATAQTAIACEHRCRHKDGSYRWLSWNAVFYDGLSYAFGRDITQQKQLEAALRQQEERWQLAIRGSNDGIWDWNIMTHEIFVSDRCKEMLGYTTDDEVGNTLQFWESLIHPDDLALVQQALQDHLNHNAPFFQVEHRVQCKDGTCKWILCRAQAVWAEAGHAVRMVGSSTDVTDRKHAEFALQQREETMRLLIQYAPANIAMFDQDMNYIMITQRGVDACQLESIDAVIGRNHYEVVPYAESWRLVHQRCLAGRIERCEESVFVREDGTLYWTRWEIHPWYKPNQEIGGIILFSEDITDRKQAEQDLQGLVEELTKLNKLKDDFLSTVSHELRTPMSSIKMATQMLEISLRPLGVLADESQPTARYFQILKSECQREISLITDLLDLTHLDAEVESLQFTAVDLRVLIPHIISSFIERADRQQQLLAVELPDNLPSLTTHLSYVERSITELLNNACKYTPAGETIRLSVYHAPPFFEIHVSNSGVEMSEMDCDRIFDKFYRIPNHDPWKYGGTGLGLSLVKKMIDRLGGTVTATSQQGEITLTLHLPCHPAAPTD